MALLHRPTISTLASAVERAEHPSTQGWRKPAPAVQAGSRRTLKTSLEIAGAFMPTAPAKTNSTLAEGAWPSLAHLLGNIAGEATLFKVYQDKPNADTGSSETTDPPYLEMFAKADVPLAGAGLTTAFPGLFDSPESEAPAPLAKPRSPFMNLDSQTGHGNIQSAGPLSFLAAVAGTHVTERNTRGSKLLDDPFADTGQMRERRSAAFNTAPFNTAAPDATQHASTASAAQQTDAYGRNGLGPSVAYVRPELLPLSALTENAGGEGDTAAWPEASRRGDLLYRAPSPLPAQKRAPFANRQTTDTQNSDTQTTDAQPWTLPDWPGNASGTDQPSGQGSLAQRWLAPAIQPIEAAPPIGLGPNAFLDAAEPAEVRKQEPGAFHLIPETGEGNRSERNVEAGETDAQPETANQVRLWKRLTDLDRAVAERFGRAEERAMETHWQAELSADWAQVLAHVERSLALTRV